MGNKLSSSHIDSIETLKRELIDVANLSNDIKEAIRQVTALFMTARETANRIVDEKDNLQCKLSEKGLLNESFDIAFVRINELLPIINGFFSICNYSAAGGHIYCTASDAAEALSFALAKNFDFTEDNKEGSIYTADDQNS